MEDINKEFLYASGSGHIDVVREFMRRGVNIDIQDNDGYTALMFASGEGQLDVVKTLLEREANIDIQGNDGYTALMFASQYNYIDVAKALLERGADINIKNDNGKTFMDCVNKRFKDEFQQIVDRVSGIYIKG